MLFQKPTRHQVKKVVKSRLFAIAALAVFTVMAVSMTVLSGRNVQIIDNGVKSSVRTLKTDPQDILKAAGIELVKEDLYSFTGFEGKEAKLVIDRAVEVNVDLGFAQKTVRLAKSTASEAVKKAGYTMTEHDYLNVDPAASLSQGMTILVTSVNYDFHTEEKPLTFGVNIVYSSDLAKDKVVEKEGSEGVQLLTYKNKKVNGEVVETELVSTEIIKKPVEAQKIIGTKVPSPKTAEASSQAAKATTTTAGLKTISVLAPSAPIALDSTGRPVSYKQLITGKATAYSPRDGGTTATGKAVRPGYIAVNPKKIPYGTKMYIRTPDGKYIYGYASAEDTGGFIKKGTIVADLFFPSYSEAIAFGVRNVEIYILD